MPLWSQIRASLLGPTQGRGATSVADGDSAIACAPSGPALPERSLRVARAPGPARRVFGLAARSRRSAASAQAAEEVREAPIPPFEPDAADPRTYRDFSRIVEVQDIFPNDLERCLELAEAEVESFPDADIPYLWVSNAWVALGEPERARDALCRGLQACRRKCFLYNALGELAMREMRAVEMARCFARSVSAQSARPLSHTPFLYLSAVAAGVDEPGSARRAHAEARRLAPGHELVPELEQHISKMAYSHREEIAGILADLEWPASAR